MAAWLSPGQRPQALVRAGGSRGSQRRPRQIASPCSRSQVSRLLPMPMRSATAGLCTHSRQPPSRSSRDTAGSTGASPLSQTSSSRVGRAVRSARPLATRLLQGGPGTGGTFVQAMLGQQQFGVGRLAAMHRQTAGHMAGRTELGDREASRSSPPPPPPRPTPGERHRPRATPRWSAADRRGERRRAGRPAAPPGPAGSGSGARGCTAPRPPVSGGGPPHG